MRAVIQYLAVLAVVLGAGAALAGGGGEPPAGQGGGSGPEPEVYALILFSLLPGVFFVRRALAVRGEPDQV